MHYTLYPKYVCSVRIDLDIIDGKIRDLEFLGGCDGNLKAMSNLCEGMDAKEAIQRLRGISCGFKPTSCGDQFARLLEKAIAENPEK